MVKKPGAEDTRTTSGVWDDAIDGGSPKSSRDSRPAGASVIARAAFGAGGCLIPLLLLAILFGREMLQEIGFHHELSAVNRRARDLGGGVSNGRRNFRHHVGAWFHGEEITDRAMPEIVAIIRDCQSHGLGGDHLSLDLSRTRVGDEGIKLLRDLPGLESVWLGDTNVTKDGVDSLRRSLPRTRIDARSTHLPENAL